MLAILRLMIGWLLQKALRAFDSLVPEKQNGKAEHQRTGQAGEETAYFHLRQLGYTIVARNFRARNKSGEIDLIAWDKDTLCFVEVKTRRSHAVKPAEAAVDGDKRKAIARVAREYLRRLEGHPTTRFDIVSIYCEGGNRPEITVFKNAFPLT
jgi:putative endonuclease